MCVTSIWVIKFLAWISYIRLWLPLTPAEKAPLEHFDCIQLQAYNVYQSADYQVEAYRRFVAAGWIWIVIPAIAFERAYILGGR